MTEDRYDRPGEGTTDWHVPINENFRDLEREVVQVVDAWADLPDGAEVERSSNGQWPRFYVLEDRVQVRVTEEATEIVGGLGSDERPLPEVRAAALETGASRSRRANGVRVVGPAGTFDSIQDAHDDLPATGGLVRVREGYDASVESFPIEITKLAHVTGAGNAVPIHAHSDDVVLRIALETTRRDAPTHNPLLSVSDLELHDGASGIWVDDTSYVHLDRIEIDEMADWGILFRERSDGDAPHSCKITNSVVRDCGKHGVRDRDGKAHALGLLNTTLESCGTGAYLQGASQSIGPGSVVQYNEGHGVVFAGSAGSFVGTYFEANAGTTGSADVYLTPESLGATVAHCYSNATDATCQYFVRAAGSGAQLRGLKSHRHAGGMVRVDGSATATDLYRGTHVFGREPFVASDQSEDTRSHGVIAGHSPTDLSGIAGDWIGQRGLDDGTNASTGPMVCTWTGEAWQPADGGSSFS